MNKYNEWILNYEFGLHHINLKISWNELKKILNDLSSEFEIHNEFDNDGSIKEIWITNYYGDKTTIAFKQNSF